MFINLFINSQCVSLTGCVLMKRFRIFQVYNSLQVFKLSHGTFQHKYVYYKPIQFQKYNLAQLSVLNIRRFNSILLFSSTQHVNIRTSVSALVRLQAVIP